MHKTICSQRLPVTILVSKDAQLKSASFDMNEKFAPGCPPTQTPTQMIQNEFLIPDSHGIIDILVSIEMIFQALQIELSRLMIELVKWEVPKIPEFSLVMSTSFQGGPINLQLYAYNGVNELFNPNFA